MYTQSLAPRILSVSLHMLNAFRILLTGYAVLAMAILYKQSLTSCMLTISCRACENSNIFIYNYFNLLSIWLITWIHTSTYESDTTY